MKKERKRLVCWIMHTTEYLYADWISSCSGLSLIWRILVQEVEYQILICKLNIYRNSNMTLLTNWIYSFVSLMTTIENSLCIWKIPSNLWTIQGQENEFFLDCPIACTQRRIKNNFPTKRFFNRWVTIIVLKCFNSPLIFNYAFLFLYQYLWVIAEHKA